MSAELHHLVDERLEGELSDERWAELLAEHGETLSQALSQAESVRAATAALPRQPLPPDLRERILAAVPRASAGARERTVATEISDAAEPAPDRPELRIAWWKPLVPVLLAAGLLVMVLPEVLRPDPGVSSTADLPSVPPAPAIEQTSEVMSTAPAAEWAMMAFDGRSGGEEGLWQADQAPTETVAPRPASAPNAVPVPRDAPLLSGSVGRSEPAIQMEVEAPMPGSPGEPSSPAADHEALDGLASDVQATASPGSVMQQKRSVKERHSVRARIVTPDAEKADTDSGISEDELQALATQAAAWRQQQAGDETPAGESDTDEAVADIAAAGSVGGAGLPPSVMRDALAADLRMADEDADSFLFQVIQVQADAQNPSVSLDLAVTMRLVPVSERATNGADAAPQLAISVTNIGVSSIPQLIGLMRLQGLNAEGQVSWERTVPAPPAEAIVPDGSASWRIILSDDLLPPAEVTALRLAVGSQVGSEIPLTPPAVGEAGTNE